MAKKREYAKGKSHKPNGFTLIELLVVISIIGVLSTIAMTSLNGARVRAKIAIVNSQINNFTNAVVVAEGEQNKTLMQITGSGHSYYPDCLNKDLRNISSSSACFSAWNSALSKIETATGGGVSGLSSLQRDPWGSPYLLNENEWESSSSPCIKDNIHSAGPDGIGFNNDDISFDLPFFKCD